MKYLSIKDAAKELGISIPTLRRWESEKKFVPAIRTEGNQRRYTITQILEYKGVSTGKLTIGYARVSSAKQSEDLERQKKVLEVHCASYNEESEIISDIGSGMNYRKKGLNKLISLILEDKISRLVITDKDRLLRFGAELIFAICELKAVHIVILNACPNPSFEEDLAKDVLEIITVFSTRLYGSRSKKNKKLIEDMEKAIQS